MTTSRFIARGATQVVALTCALAFSTSPLADPGNSGKPGAYDVTKLVSDVPGLTTNQDTNLVNGWGIVAGPTTPMWV